MLCVFAPDGPRSRSSSSTGKGFRSSSAAIPGRLIVHFEAPEELYRAAARGGRTIPLDAVGVDQAAVLVAAAIENLALGRTDRVVTVPRGIQIDVSDPAYLSRIVDFTRDFEVHP